MALRVVDENLHRVEPHRLGVDQPDQELGRVEELEERRLVGRPGKGRGVRLGKAEAGEGRALAEQLLGVVARQAVLGDRSLDELGVKLLHLPGGAPRPHRPSEGVRARRGEPGDLDRDPHHLLLVEDHPETVPEHRLEARMKVVDRLEALLPPEVGMDRVALDGPRADDRHLDHQVVQALRARLGERLHLGPALDLEDADGVGRLEHLEDLRNLLRQPVEVEAQAAVVLDQLDRLVDRGQHPEAQQVQLDQLQRLDVALVVLGHDAAGHRRSLQRGDIDQRCGGDQHPAGVDRQVAGKAVDPGAELEPALPVGEVLGRAAAWLGRRFGFDASDR